MKIVKTLVLVLLMLMLTSCGESKKAPEAAPLIQNEEVEKLQDTQDILEITMTDDEIKLNGVAVGSDKESAVYTAHDIVYYEDGKDFTYGEGDAGDAHTAEEASEHTVVHISRPGIYRISGILDKGQIAVDLGNDAKDDPDAVVTLILNGVHINSEVAPAIIFYNVYECADKDKASKDVDTSGAGARVIIADGTENSVNGSYVARIYKPESVVLSEDGTKVEDSKKLHKYDAAFYSKMSMDVSGGEKGDGVLIINAENEGLDSELHLTLNGGKIYINSGNDGINTNEDGVSVTTVNGGELYINVTGETGEGDGIDSNGWLVINGGLVTAEACSFSMDSGIDSDMGIYINGGTVLATGSMLDRIEDGGQNYAVFNFMNKGNGGKTVSLKNQNGDTVFEFAPENDYSVLIYSSSSLNNGVYTLWGNDVQLSVGVGEGMGRPGRPVDGKPMQRPLGEMPPTPPEGMEFPEGRHPFEDGRKPDGDRGKWNPNEKNDEISVETTTEFVISDGGNMFTVFEAE